MIYDSKAVDLSEFHNLQQSCCTFKLDMTAPWTRNGIQGQNFDTQQPDYVIISTQTHILV